MTSPPTSSRPLPPYRAVLAVDAKDFTKLPSSSHEDTSAAIRKVVGAALRDAGLEAEFAAPAFFGDTGDGFAVGLPTHALPYLIDPFPALLQRRLMKRRAKRPGEVPLRLRVSVHVGPLPADPAAPTQTGNGAARNETHRLLDADVVREALRDASPEITLVAMIISNRVYDDVVEGRYTGLHPDHFVPVTARVTGKPFEQAAWLHLPAQPGRPVAADEPLRADHAPSPDSGSIVHRNYGQVARTNFGGMHMTQGSSDD